MKPIVYGICGLPGAGKTKFSERLSRETNGVIFTSDAWIIKKYGRDFPYEKFVEYQNEIREAIAREAKKMVKQGRNVILDYGFWTKRGRDEYRKMAGEWGADFVLYYLEVPFDELVIRLKKRNKRQPEDSLEVTEEMLRKFSENFEPPVEDGLTVVRVH